MPQRKPITKTTRFEVFKRDSFTCQYCGRMAPDVILEIDHIKPVSDGGGNDILNLITSCKECNRGKGKRKLDDSSVVEKQRKQLKELNERHIQLQMMMEWRDSLAELIESQVDTIDVVISGWFSATLSDHGRRGIKMLIKRFGFEEVYASANIAVEKYDDVETAINKIGGICYNRLHGRTGPDYAK